jgi:hypothetical protein
MVFREVSEKRKPSHWPDVLPGSYPAVRNRSLAEIVLIKATKPNCGTSESLERKFVVRDFIKLEYYDFVAIRDLMRQVDQSQDPLSTVERLALAKTERIVELMEAKRRDELSTGQRRIARQVWT